MTTAWILIMLWASGGASRPPTNITVEFANERACRYAEAYFTKIHNQEAKFVGGGCFKKELP